MELNCNCGLPVTGFSWVYVFHGSLDSALCLCYALINTSPGVQRYSASTPTYTSQKSSKYAPPITQQLSVFLFVLDSPIYLALPVCSHETSDHIHGKKCYPSKYLLPKLIRGGVWKSPFMLEFGCLDLM